MTRCHEYSDSPFELNLLQRFFFPANIPGAETDTSKPSRRRLSKGWPGPAHWALLAVLAALLTLTLAACTGRDIGGVASGWNALTASDGVVYVGTKDGQVQALRDGDSDVPVGLWRFPRSDSNSSEDLRGVFGAPLVAEGLLFVAGENGFLYALDPENGSSDDRGWRRPRGQPQGIAPLVAGPAYDPINRLVLAPSEDGRLYAYVADSGEDAETWAGPFQAGDKIWSSPVVGTLDGIAMAWFGSHDHHVYAINVSTGEEIWSHRTGGVVAGRPLLFDGMVIAGSFDKKLYALDARDGSLLWEFEGNNWFWAGAVTNGGTVFAPNMDGRIYALDRDGILQWEYDSGAPIVSRPVLVPAGLAAANRNGELILLDVSRSASQRELRKLTLGSAEITAPLYAVADSIFVGSQDGSVRRVDATTRRPLEEWWCWHPENDNNRCN